MDKNKLCNFFSGQATVDDKKEIFEWLDKSPENEKIFLEERRAFNLVILHAEDNVERTNPLKQKVALWANNIARIVAIFAILFGGYYFFIEKQNRSTIAYNTIRVPSGQQVTLELSDGTKVNLNARSVLKYPAVFSDNNRKVELEGEGYFEVTHNEKKPFIVQTNVCNVEVLGTVFNVEAYPNSGKVSTMLLSGKVKVVDRINTNKQIVLIPNQEVVYTGKQYYVDNIRFKDRLRWTEGLICFEDKKFVELMKDFEKYYGVQINVNNKDLQNHEISGKLRIKDGVDHALRALQKNITFNYEKNDNIVDIR